MSGVNIDPAVLEVVAAASHHAWVQASDHIAEEIKARDPNNLTTLVGSLTDEGPYAYTILPEVRADGTVRLPVLTTRDEIAEMYKFIRGMSDLHEVIGLTEVHGAWYTFQDSLTRGAPTGQTQLNNRETLGLFPSGAGSGITGELVWLRVHRERLGAADEPNIQSADPLLARRQVYDQLHAYLEGLRANDVGAILAVLHDSVASAVRDYVGETGTLIELDGKDAHRSWFNEFFATYAVQSVEPLFVVAEDWYVFAELRVNVIRHSEDEHLAFNVAEFYVPSKDGRFIARIGHGTAPS